MSLKFTKCGVGSESGDESLLFEFLDQECPEFIELEWVSELVNHKFIGSLQTHQHQGVFLEPITFNFKFFGAYIDANNNPITAKRRFDQLARLQGRVIKFWFEGIKQLVIIKNCKVQFHNYQHVSGSLTLAPHDLQVAIKPTEVHQFKLQSSITAQVNSEPSKELLDKKVPLDLTPDNLKTITENNLTKDEKKNKEIVIKSRTNLINKLEDFKKDINSRITRDISPLNPAKAQEQAELKSLAEETEQKIIKQKEKLRIEKGIKIFQ